MMSSFDQAAPPLSNVTLAAGGATTGELSEGDEDPYLKRQIKILIVKTDDFIVYLDQELETQWWGTIEWPSFAGRVLSRVSKLESMSSFLIGNPRLRFVRCLIGEGLARMLDGCSEKEAQSVLDDAEIEIKLRNRETSRLWFFSAAATCAVVFVLPALVMMFERQWFISELSRNGFEIVTSALLGAAGAIGSISIRSNVLGLDANAGRTLHFIEACARVFIGVIGALILALMIKSGLLLSALDKPVQGMSLLWALGIVAGASERVLPGLIKKGEDVVLSTEKGS